MYKIKKTDGTELGYVDSVRYIKVGANGKYVNATKTEAQGVALEGKAYCLGGHTEIDGDTVIVSEVSTAKVFREMLARIDYLSMKTGIDTEIVIEKETKNDEGKKD